MVGISLVLSPVDKIYLMTDCHPSQDILLSGGEHNIKMLLKKVLRYPHWASCVLLGCFLLCCEENAARRMPAPHLRLRLLALRRLILQLFLVPLLLYMQGVGDWIGHTSQFPRCAFSSSPTVIR